MLTEGEPCSMDRDYLWACQKEYLSDPKSYSNLFKCQMYCILFCEIYIFSESWSSLYIPTFSLKETIRLTYRNIQRLLVNLEGICLWYTFTNNADKTNVCRQEWIKKFCLSKKIFLSSFILIRMFDKFIHSHSE